MKYYPQRSNGRSVRARSYVGPGYTVGHAPPLFALRLGLQTSPCEAPSAKPAARGYRVHSESSILGHAIYPTEDSVCPSPSPYIGDGGEHYMSALPFSVCPLAPSRSARYRGLCTVRSERVRSRHPHPNYSPQILGSASAPTSSIRSRREEPLPPLGTHSSPPL